MLNLYEEILLLALHEEKGAVVASAVDNLGYGLAGAILADLALHGRVKVEDSHRLLLVSPESTGDEVLDEAFQKITGSDRPRKVGYWVNSFSEKPKKATERLLDRLEMKGILRQEDSRYYPVIPFPECPGQKASAKYWIKNRLRTLALTEEETELRGLALLCLAQSCNMMELIFTKDERKAAARRIYALMVGASLESPVAQSIDEISRAVESLSDSD